MPLGKTWKKVAIALNSLIRGQYPRDALYVVPFSYYAREIKPEDLPRLTWNEWGGSPTSPRTRLMS